MRLYEFGFDVIAARCDGAGQNRALLNMLSQIPASEYLSCKQCEDIRFAGLNPNLVKVATTHPITQQPIFLGTDDPHNIKRARNALDRSTQHKKGSLLCPKEGTAPLFCSPANLRMLKRCWVAVEGGVSGIRVNSRLTLQHFELTRFNKMRVPYAVQVLSDSSVRLIHAANSAGKLETSLSLDEPAFDGYDFLIEYLTRFNRMWDIVNSRPSEKGAATYIGPGITDPEDPRLEELISFVLWLYDWRKSVFTYLEYDDATNAFIPAELYTDLLMSCLSSVCLARYCLINARQHRVTTVFFRKLQQDTLEHHFAHIRRSTGSTQNPDGAAAARGSGIAAGHHIINTSKTNCKSDIPPHLRKSGSEGLFTRENLMKRIKLDIENTVKVAATAVAETNLQYLD